jgi:hypothetical protein
MALVEDTYGTRGPPRRARLALRRSGAAQHLRECKLLGPVEPGDRVRSGSLLVLCAWALFMIAGAAFAKFSEQWDASAAPVLQGLPAGAYVAVQWAGLAGIAMVALGALIAIPGLTRLVRSGRFDPVRAPMRRALLVTGAAAATTVGLVAWAHHLSPHDRNGGQWPYLALGTVWAVLVCVSIVLCTAAVVAAASRIEVSTRTWRTYRALAVGLALTMFTVLAATVTWWATLATCTPRVLDRGLLALPAGRLPPGLVMSVILMIVGSLVAAVGLDRTVRARA